MRIHFRHLMLYEFQKGSSVTIATKNICAVYGENALSSRTCRKWFQRFRAGNFCLKDEERSGRPPQTDEDKIRDLVEKSRSLTVQEMLNILKIPKTTIHRCLKKMRMVSKLNVWVPHELTERNRLERTTAYMSLLARNKHEPFLKRLVTGDEIGYFTKILNGNVAGPNEISHLNAVQNQGYIHVKFFCVYGGIIKEYSILNFYLVVIPLIQTNIALS